MKSKLAFSVKGCFPWLVAAAILLAWFISSFADFIHELYTIPPSTGILLPLEEQTRSLKVRFDPGHYVAQIFIKCDASSKQGDVEGTFTLKITGPSGEAFSDYKNAPLQQEYFWIECVDNDNVTNKSDWERKLNPGFEQTRETYFEIPDGFDYVNVEASFEFPENSHYSEGAAFLSIYGTVNP